MVGVGLVRGIGGRVITVPFCVEAASPSARHSAPGQLYLMVLVGSKLLPVNVMTGEEPTGADVGEMEEMTGKPEGAGVVVKVMGVLVPAEVCTTMRYVRGVELVSGARGDTIVVPLRVEGRVTK